MTLGDGQTPPSIGGGGGWSKLRNYYSNCHSTYEKSDHEPQAGLDTRTDRLADRQL